MNPEEIDRALRLIGTSGAMGTTDNGSFRAGVWREIRHRKALGTMMERMSVNGISDFSLFPKWALAGLAIAIASALLTGGVAQSRSGDGAGVTVKILDLRVFSPELEVLADDRLIVGR